MFTACCGSESLKVDAVTEEHILDGREITVRWRGSDFSPPRYLVRQASGICITHEGLIVLVSGDGKSWGLPGGHPEKGETLKETFIREISEEACAMVTQLSYLGVSEVADPGNPEGFPVTYQARFWARVRLDEFKPEYETTDRKLVSPDDLITTLNWYPARIIRILLETALEYEQQYRLKKG